MAFRVMVHNGGEEKHSRRLQPFDYSGKTILSAKDCDEKIKKETARVRSLVGKSTPWCKSKRKEKEIFFDDTVKVVDGIGKKTEQILKEADVVTVEHLR